MMSFVAVHKTDKAQTMAPRMSMTNSMHQSLHELAVLKYRWQLWAAIKSLWLGCPAEISDVTISPFIWWLNDAHVLVQVIVW